MRAHLYRTVLKSDGTGPLDPGASVRVLQPDASVLLADPLFSDGSSSTTLNNPFTLSGATIDFYLDTPQRVDLGITPVGSGTEYVVAGQDVILPKDVGADGRETWPFFYTGPLSVLTGTQRLYVERTMNILSIRASVGVAPTGASVMVDVKVNGGSVFTSTGHRPAIAAGTFTALASTVDNTSLALGDYITVDITQVGSTIAGADLTVTLEVAP